LSQISGGATWFWDFGDGTAGNTQNPVHVYPIAGSYQVCLTVGDNTGCVDTVCQMINIGTGIDLDGYIYASPAQVDTYKVYLIEYSAVGGGTLTALDSQIVSGSPAYYNFGSISPLVYYTKAAMIPTSPSYSSFMPTYHDSVLFWSNATPINFMSGPPPTGGDIWMVQGNNPGGLGFIGGLISQGANKTNTIAENIEILLFDDNMNPITHVASDINGAFAFPNLAYGTYKIYPEMINKVTIPFTVTLNATQPSINDIDFIIQHDSIYATNTVAITPPSFIVESVGFPHPNPTKDWLNMDISLKQAAEIHFEVYTLTGQVVHRQSAKIEAGTFTETIHLGSLAQGFYLLRVLEGNQQIGNFKIVKD
jgi:PKD repeat protein